MQLGNLKVNSVTVCYSLALLQTQKNVPEPFSNNLHLFTSPTSYIYQTQFKNY